MTQYTFTKDAAEQLLGEDIAADVWDEMRTIAETEGMLEELEKSDDVLGDLPNDSVSLDAFFDRLNAIIAKLNLDTRAAGHALEAHAQRVQNPAALFIQQAKEFLDRVAGQPLTPEGVQKMKDGHLLLDDPGTPGATSGEDLRKAKLVGGRGVVENRGGGLRVSEIDSRSGPVTASPEDRANLESLVTSRLEGVYGKGQAIPQQGPDSDYEPVRKDAKALLAELEGADLSGAPAAVRSAVKTLADYLKRSYGGYAEPQQKRFVDIA
jgi:hypothetical protein